MPVETIVAKVGEDVGVDAVDLISSGKVDLVVNTPRGRGPRADGMHIRRAAIVHGVAVQTVTGVSVDAAPGTRVDNMTLVDVTNGVVLKRGSGNAGLEFSASAARAVVRGYSGVAFGATDAAEWSFDHCAAQAAASGTRSVAADRYP